MNCQPLSQEVYDLLEAICFGELSREQAARLERLLQSEPDQCRHYVRFMQMHAIAERCESANLPDRQAARVPQSAADLLRHKSPVLGFLARTTASINRPVYWSILGFGMLFAGYFVLISWGILSRDVARKPNFDKPAAGNPRSVARITDPGDAEWASDTARQEPAIEQGEPLQISSGLVALTLGQGTKLVIEGPAEWSIDGTNQATLKYGRLLANVPRQAVGFTVETPTARIVDLGTEFGVAVEKSGTAEVHVIKGRIDIHSEGGTTAAPLRAGQGATITADGVQTRRDGSTADKFKRVVEAAASKSTASQKTVRSIGTRQLDLSRAQTSASSVIDLIYATSYAIDNKPETYFHSGNDDRAPWWQVDLGSPHSIAAVTLSSVPDTRLGRFRDLTIKILAEDGKTVVAESPLLNPKNALGGGELDWWNAPKQLTFEPARTAGKQVIGRFVRVERQMCDVDGSGNDRMVLMLAEVQIYEEIVDSKSAATPRRESK